MNKYNDLLTRIANTHNIVKGAEESVNDYKVRIIYSAIGEAAFASLWDTFESGEPVSVRHMKNRIATLLQDYKDLYSELVGDLTYDKDELCKEIYEVFMHSGAIYHEPNRITPATKSNVRSRKILFTRGHSPGIKQNISGLGTYLFNPDEQSSGALTEMFQIDDEPLDTQWKNIISNVSWTPSRNETNTEYLNTRLHSIKGYWVDKPDKSGDISICRTVMPGSRLYYLYRYDNGVMVSPIPQWMLEYPLSEDNNTENHRALTNACLASLGKLPPSKYHVDGAIVRINIGYLMPPAIMAFVKLYSWPESCVSLPQNFRRVCSLEVFEEIKNMLTSLAYDFIKE